MGAVHRWAPSPAQRWPMAQGNRQPPQGKNPERAAVVSGAQGAGSPWAMVEQSTPSTRGIESCHSSGACSGSIGARGWWCQNRTRSSVATCQRQGQSCAKSRTCPRGDHRSCTSQSGQIGSCALRSCGSFGTRSRVSESNTGTCQSCRVPSASGRPVDAMPTVHRPNGETPVRLQEARGRL